MLKQYIDFDAKHIIKTFNSSPAYDGRLNGLDVMIMQSDENYKNLLSLFKDAIEKGYNPNDVKDDIFNYLDLTEEDLIETDCIKLIREVEDFYKKFNM